MHRSEHRNRERRTLRPSAPRMPFFSSSRINALKRAAAFSQSGPDARNDLSLACNESRSHGLHSRVNVPGLLLRFQPAASATRSALRSATDSRFAPVSATSTLRARCRFHDRPDLPLTGLHSPSGLLHPSRSERSAGSLQIDPPSVATRFPFAPRCQHLLLVAGLGSTFPVRYRFGGLLFLKPLGTSLTMLLPLFFVNKFRAFSRGFPQLISFA
jgi:hypothetical protein